MLSQWLSNQIEESESTRLEAHIARCAECQRGLEEVTNDADLHKWEQLFVTKQTNSHRHSQVGSTSPAEACELDVAFLKRVASSLAAQRRKSDLSPLPKLTVSGYDILEELGKGGMGVVHKARHVELDRIVALKLVLSGALATDAERSRFHREAEVVAQLHHPNIVQIYDVGTSEGNPYLSLEYVEGSTLATLLEKGPLCPRKAAELVESLAQAMHIVHRSGIVHRDLKPGNILINSDGVAKITDFGLAKRQDISNLTQTSVIMGTPGYLAPEQSRDAQSATPSSDTYSLGAILYETLTGQPPFHAATVVDTLIRVRFEAPLAPSRLRSEVPRDLETICLKCLEKDPGKRYESAQDLADDLGRYLRGEPIIARPISAVGRAVRWCRRKPLVASMLAAFLVVLVTGTTVSLLFAFKAALRAEQAETSATVANQAKTEAETRLYFQTISLADQEWERNNVSRSEELLGQCKHHLRRWEWFYLKDRCQSARLDWRSPKHEVKRLAFTSDGKYLVGAQGWGGICFWDARTGTEAFTLKAGKRYVESITLNSTGDLCATGTHESLIDVWDVRKRKLLYTLRGHQGRILGIAFSPDNTLLASASEDKSVRLWKVGTRECRAILEGHTGPVRELAFHPDGKRH